MAPRKRKEPEIKVKEAKLNLPTGEMMTRVKEWGLETLFTRDWSQPREDLVRELVRYQNGDATIPRTYKIRGKPKKWTADIWRQVYDLPGASEGGYLIRGKVQFAELQVLKLVVGDKRLSKSGVQIDQVDGTKEFKQFCQLLNPVFAPLRPEHFQHNQLVFYHHAWLALQNPTKPVPNWGEAVEKAVSRQLKSLGASQEPTCLGPYLAHLYSKFNEWGATPTEEKEDEPQKKKGRTLVLSEITPQSSTSSPPMEKELGKFLLDLKKGSTRILSLIQQQGEVKGTETEDDVAETLKRTLTPTPPTDLTPWKNSVTTLLRELSLERAHTQRLKKQRTQLEMEVARGKKIPEMTSWVAEQLKLARDTEQKMGARIEALEAALHAKGGHVTATEEESASS
ncbi:hypothetical protein R1sor_010706 [Riccia sorocarpa]|uniref:Uncharacterized protein n=1 Tax=Riccia sorocarpa TaxID=122646 RepID=A0ABD3HYT6_9MARC